MRAYSTNVSEVCMRNWCKKNGLNLFKQMRYETKLFYFDTTCQWNCNRFKGCKEKNNVNSDV